MKKATKFAIIIIPIVASLIFGGYVYLDKTVSTDKFYKGISIEGISMEGLTLEEGIARLKGSKEETLDRQLTLKAEDYSHIITMRNLQLTYNFEETALEAFQIGRTGNIVQKFSRMRELAENPVQLSLKPHFGLENLETLLDEVEVNVNKDPVDAQFSFESGEFKIIKPSAGVMVDRESFLRQVRSMGKELLDKDELLIPMIEVEPEIAEDYYERINGAIGEFSTSFAGSSPGRVHNIRLSAESFKGMLIMPGQTVSYNKTTGPRQASYGYQEAPVIFEGELTPGMGGGVCQTSTTLYNALLLADLKIVERSPHSIPPAYVPRGTDAAVATGYLDLVFRNDFDYPVMIDSKVEGTKVYFKVYGDKDNRDYEIRISTSSLATIPYRVHENLDETLEPGKREMVQEGRTGYRVNTFKSKVKDGKIISTEQISHDYYRERDFIYKVGPAAPKVVPVETIEEVEAREPHQEPLIPSEEPDPLDSSDEAESLDS